MEHVEIEKEKKKNLEGYVIWTLVTSLVIDFNKISDGLTRVKSRNPTLHTLNPKKKNQQKPTPTIQCTPTIYWVWSNTHEACFWNCPQARFPSPSKPYSSITKSIQTKHIEVNEDVKIKNIYKSEGTKGYTLLEIKSTRSSALSLRGLELDVIFFQSSLRVEGVLEAADADKIGSMDRSIQIDSFLPV